MINPAAAIKLPWDLLLCTGCNKLIHESFVSLRICQKAHSVACMGKRSKRQRCAARICNPAAHVTGDKVVFFTVNQQDRKLGVANSVHCAFLRQCEMAKEFRTKPDKRECQLRRKTHIL